MFSADAQPAPELVRSFQIPSRLLADVYRRSNGFFSSAETFDQNGHLESCRKIPIACTARNDLLTAYRRHLVSRPG